MLGAETDADADAPVALITQRRITEAGYARYAHWLGKVATVLAGWPGFTGQEVIPPTPPMQVDWVAVQRFTSAAAARAWLQSRDCTDLVNEVRDLFVGQEDIHLLPDAGGPRGGVATAVVSFQVPPGQETEFLAWQRDIQCAEAEFPGFLRHRVERPIPGIHDEWIIILAFENNATMTAWLDSPQRRAVLERGARFNANINLRRSSYGFDFWFPTEKTRRPGPLATFKNNLLVLLVLYPLVFLWGIFVSAPLLAANDVPFWLALFIGNFVTTQLLGWGLVPLAFRGFGWWLAPDAGPRREILGAGLIILLYGLSMALCAALLAM